jgi:hypothetical protein
MDCVVDARLLVAGLASGALASGCAGRPAHDVVPTTATDNQRVLTHGQSLLLLNWARRFRRCMVASGTDVGAVVPSTTQISMRLPGYGGTRAPAVLRKGVACGDKQGGPPPTTSLQYRRGQFVLYLPKQCLLDPKVTAP